MNSTKAIDDLIDTTIAAAQDLPALSRKPEGLLHHFTDAAGIIGIIRDKQLRATRASCMNDEREILHGRDVGRSVVARRLDQQPGSRFSGIWQNAIDYFDSTPEAPSIPRIKFDAFVVSFCADVNKSVHWLHYGRGGHGYAIGLDPRALDRVNWSLVPVTYERELQEAMMASVFEKIEQKAAALVDEIVSPTKELVSEVELTAGHLLGDVSSMLAPCFKHESFKSEEEWRLFRTTAESDATTRDEDFRLSFRSSGGLVVPYAEFSLGSDAVRAITMGYQVPEHPSKESFRLLLRENQVDPANVTIGKSGVPVRGAA